MSYEGSRCAVGIWKRLWRTAPILALLCLVTCWPSRLSTVQAQGSAGYVLVGSCTSSPCIDTAPVDGATYTYQITGTNSGGESGPSPTSNAAKIPTTGTHTVTVNFTGNAADTGYNLYRFLVPAPVAPSSAPTAVVN